MVIYWDRKVETAKDLSHNRPDVVVVDKRKGKWTLVDFSVPMDNNVVKKEDERVEKYIQLDQEIRKMHKVNTEIIPIVIGALGTVPKRLSGELALTLSITTTMSVKWQNFIEALPTMSYICLLVKLNPLGAGAA